MLYSVLPQAESTLDSTKLQNFWCRWSLERSGNDFFFLLRCVKKNIKRKISLRNFRNSNYFDDKKR